MAAEYLERLGGRIRERREELGLSRADVARKMPGKTNENAVYRWETGKHRPHDDALEALAGVLAVDVSFFLASPAESEPPGDLLGALSPGASQLDRVERKLDAIIAHLGIDLTSDDPADEPEVDLEDAIAAAEALAQVPRPKRGRGGAAVPTNAPEAPAK